jgi:Cof subfamily protein (haloacid dehalogenase superfamily)
LDIRAVAIDLDGTVLHSDQTIGVRTAAALRRCNENNIPVILCTGRSFGSASRYVEELGLRGPQVVGNGAQIINIGDDGSTPLASSITLAENHQMDLDSAALCAKVAREHNSYYQVYFTKPGEFTSEWTVANMDNETARAYRFKTRMDIRFSGLEEALEDARQGRLNCLKCLFIAEPDTVNAMKDELEPLLGSRSDLMRSWPTYLEVLPHGVSKGTGLASVLARRGISGANCAAFGDEENDIPMFTVAAISCAPANSRDITKKAAKFVIPSNEDDGVGQFLEKNT